MKKTFVASLVIVLLVLIPACKRRKIDVVPPQPATDTAPPEVAMPTETATPVEAPRDFVQETPAPVEEVIPSDIEELNRFAQQKGYIRDAFFNYDESTLDESAQAALSASATWLKSSQGATYKLLIEGHCDERGTEQYNLALGDRRANTARDYLTTLGVDGSRIRTVSYGEERPFDEGHDDSAWSKNRRAHLVLVR